MALYRRSVREGGEDAARLPDGDGIQKAHPDLYDFLALAAFEDGTARERGTLLLFVQDGRWKACLNDKADSCTCFVSGGTVKEVLAAANAALGAGKGDWRAYRAERGGKGGRR